ncbi:MAG: hypothetical protein LBM69_03965 [Lachnospiraceae bacterium]|jgi:hypothetical protein|nr:hypothetical protein [Lachnospiraceae bacterium]
MKATIRSKSILRERQELGKVLPLKLCRDCTKFLSALTDNLDPYAQELLERFEKLETM